MKKVLLRTISALTIVAVMFSAVSINAKPTETKPFFIGLSDGLLNGKAISDATFHKTAPLAGLNSTKTIADKSAGGLQLSLNKGFQSFSPEAAPLLLGPVLSGCSSNISVGNTTNLCGANVNYTEPTASEASRDTTVTFAYNSAKGIDSFSIPAGINSVTIRAQGAAGGTRFSGATGAAGGRGASMQGVFTVPASRKIYYLIGQKGGSAPSNNYGAGGGGGTFVSTESTFSSLSNLLLAAGGGGGASYNNGDTAGKKDANITLWANAGSKPAPVANYAPGDGGGATGGVVNATTSAQGVAGSKGVAGGAGGAGWTANGQDADFGALSGGKQPALSVSSNASGIPISNSLNGVGGYGGGGSGFNGGGGGGGFNGGGGGSKNSVSTTSGSWGGGGGSYNSSASTVNLKGTGITDGGGLNDGFVTITWTITPIVTVTRIAGLAPGSLFPIGTTTVTYQATDDLGLSSTCSFTVTVADTQAPTITAPANVTVNVDANSCTASNVSLGTPVFSDNCPGVTVSNNAPSIFPKGTTTVTWTAKDAANNTSTATQTVTVVDNIPPVITCPPNVSVTAAGTSTTAVVTYSAATATDNCGTPTITYSIPSGSTFNIGTTQVTATATDASGNTATCTFNVIVTGGSSPAITVSGNTILIPNGDVTYTTADNTDMGSTTTGTPLNKVFSINSVGTAPLIVSSIIGSGPDGAKFGINGAPTFPATIAVGNSNTFTVTFFSNTPGTYFLTITVASNDPAIPNYVYNVKATAIAPLTPGSIGSPQSICTGATPTALTSSSAASGGTGSISYQWQSSTDGVNFNNISGATSSTFAPGSLTTTTYYRRSAFTANDAIVNSNTVVVTVNPLPTVTAGSNSPVCAGSSLTLSSTAGMTTYAWSGPNSFTSTAQNPTVSSSATAAMGGTYSVTVTDANGCSNTASTSVTVNPKPTVAISPSSVSIVTGNSTTLTASGAVSYTWTPTTGLTPTTGATVTANPTTTTTYTVTGTDANGCTNTATSTVTVTSSPAITITGNTILIPNGDVTYTTADNTDMGSTTTGTPINKVFSINSVGTAPLVVTSIIGSGPDGAKFGINGAPTFPATIAVGNSNTYTVTFFSNTPGTYFLTITVASNDPAIPNYVYNVKATAIAPLTPGSIGSPQSICTGATPTALTSSSAASGGTGSISYQWQSSTDGVNFNNISGATSSTFAPGSLTTTTYYRRSAFTANDAIVNSNTVAVTVNPLPTVTAGSNSPVCAGSSLTLSSTAGMTTYAWSGPNSFASSAQNPTVSNSATTAMSGTYTVAVTDANGCANTASTSVTVNANVTPTFTQVAAICSGSTLSALPVVSNNGIPGNWSPALNNTATTTYTFTPAAGQCATTATMTITVNPNVTPTFTQVAAICSGATLSALPATSTNGITGTWSPALNNTATTTYTFTPSAGQCATTATMTITVNAAPTVFTIGNTGDLCATGPGYYITLSGSDPGGVVRYEVWRPGNGTGITVMGDGNPLIIGPMQVSGTFFIVATNTVTNCTSTMNGTITVNLTSTVTPTFTQVAAICSGTTLSALPTTSNNNITGTWSPALNNTATTTYTFTPSAGQCASTATMTITVNALPNATANNNGPACNGGSLSLTASGGVSYLWSGPNGFNSTSSNTGIGGITAAWAGVYNVQVTDANGCVNTATTTVVVNSIAPIGGLDHVCAGSTTTLTGSGTPATTNPWWSNNQGVATINNAGVVTGIAPGSTLIIYTNSSGCTVNIFFTVNALPNAPTGTNASACAPSGVTISATAGAGLTINWYDAATGGSQIGTGNTFYTNNSGTFYAEAVNAAGCVSATRTAVTATVNPLPMITGGAAAICINGTTTFNGSGTPAAVTPWVSSDPSIASVDNNGVVTGHASGSVQIMYTTSAGCSATVGVFVSGFPGVGILPSGATAICAGTSVTLNSNSEGGLTYVWTPGGATTSSITVNTAGTYTLEGTNSFGCKATASVTVTVNALPNAPTGTSASACAPSGVTISASGAVGETINWYATPTGGTPVSVGNNFNTNVSGTFYAEAVSAAGCVSATRTAVTATINPAATITGGASKICLNGTTTLTGSGTPAVSNAWVSSDPSVASVDNAGVVTAHTTGNTTITYTNIGGCTANTNIQVTGLPGVGILPSGSTAICGGSSITLNSNSEAGLTYIWTPGGATTSSITVNTAGTYTLEGTNSFGCKSTASVTVTVNALPNAPTGTNASVCAPFGATISASGAAGESIKWYSTATGGTPVSVGNTLNTNVSGTFYAEAVSTAGCASATRTAVTATINALPVVSISGPTCLGVSAINVTATNASQVQWFLNGSPFTVNSTINPAGTVVAGGNGAGAGLNQLNALNDIFVDAAGNVYVAEQNNHRITKWTPGATSGVVVAGGNGVGNAANQLNNPNEVIVDASGNVYVSDFLNHRVQKWAPGATSGVTVAGGNGQGTALNQTPYPDGIALDAAGNLYVLEDDLYPSLPPRVTKWAPGATSGVVVVSAGFGAGANQLMDPERIVLDAAGNIYIGDYVNHRVQKWAQGASSGVTVAGGNGDGTNPNQLHSIAGLYLDAANNLYIVDPSSPSRIQKWASGATSGTTVLTSSGSANTATSFTSGGIGFDASGSMYLGDYQYNRVMKFTSSLATSYVPTAPGTYSVTVSSAAGCTANSNSVVVNALPTVSNITGTTTICSGNTTTLTAISGANSPVFKWYSVATGGTALFTGASFTTPSLSTTTTYYVEVTDGNTCVSATRTAVTVTVNPLPTVSGISGTTTVCSGSSTSLTASSAASSPNFTWYDAATGGNNVGGGATLNTGTLFTTTTYYVQVSSNGCTSATRTAVTVTVNPKPSTLSYTVHANCDGTTTISINNATGPVLWNTNAITTSITVSTTGTYGATQTVNGCTSPVSSVNITSIPTATPTPGISVVDNCDGTSTLTASGIVGSFHWSTGVNNVSPITVNTGGTYTLQQVANGCVSGIASATASPKNAPAKPVVTVVDNCDGTSTLSTNASGSLLWNTGETTSTITVTTAGTYGVSTTINGCTSAIGTNIASPKITPSAPIVTVVDNCDGTSTLSTKGSGSLLWSTSETTPDITVTSAGTYTVTATALGCTSTPGSGFASPRLTPVFTQCPSNIVTNTQAGVCTAVVTYTSIATGTPAPSMSYSLSGATTASGTGNGSGSTFNKGVTTVTISATNSCGTVTCIFTVTVEDHEAPVIVNLPTNISKTNDAGVCGAVVTWPAVTATDNCPVVNVVSDHNSGEVFPVGTTTVHYTATDASGNTAAGSFTVTVTDTEKPTFTCPSDITVTANTTDGQGVAGYIATYSVTASDNCGTTTTVFSTPSGSFFPIGNTPVTVTVTDSHGNVQTCTFHVIVNCVTPVFTTSPVDQTINTTIGRCDAPATYTATASGIPAANLSYTFTGATTGSGSGTGSGSIFNKGVTTVTVTATNICGSVSTSFTVTVEDHEAPVIVNLPTNISKTNDAGVCGAVVTWPAVTATDNCPVVNVVSDHNSGEVFPVGTTTVHYTATDASGNTAAGSFTVTVTDTEKPTFTCPGDITVAGQPGLNGATISSYTVTDAADNCGVPTVAYSINPGHFFALGTTTPVTITVTDAAGNHVECTINVTVTNNPPVANPDFATTPEDTPVSGNVLTNDTDIDGGALSVTNFHIGTNTYAAGTTATIPGVGTLVINANGTFTFTPAPNYDGAVPVATYDITDGNGGVASSTLTITIIPVNDPPVANPDFATTPEDTPVSGNVLTNDTDIDGGALSVTNFHIGTNTYAAGTTATIPGVGTLVINANGTFTFTPAPNYDGAVPVATYDITDGNGGVASSTLTITIIPVNDPPVANPDFATTPEDTPVSGNVLTNDTDIDGGALSVTNFHIGTNTYAAGTTATIPGVGTLVINANGTFTFTPAPNYDGAVPVATYDITDGNGGVASSTLTITIIPVNDPPVANPDFATTPEDTPVSGNVLNNDTDVEHDVLSVTAFHIGTDTYTAGTTATIPGVGTLVINTDGTFTFTPAPNFNGNVPVATYDITDGHGGVASSTLTITVTPVNDAPVANPDVATTPEDTPVSGNVLNNDTDVEHDVLSVTAFHIGTDTYTAGTTATIPGVGTLVINTDGTFTFTPAPNFNGNVPVATYDITDGHGGVASSTLTITVTPVNDAPVANPDVATTPEDTPVSGNVLNNDTDVEHDVLSVTAFHIGTDTYTAGTTATIPGVGTLVINTDGTFTFTPAPNFNGNVPVATYDITDGHGGVASSTLTITVTPVNDAPVANPDVATTPEDTPVSGNVLNNDTDVEHDVLSVTAFHIGTDTYTAGTTATIPGVGTLVINTDGTFTFTPAPNFNGNVPVATYDITDGHGGVASSTLTITVTPVNDAPVANPDVATTPEDTPVSGNVLNNDTDVEHDVLSVTAFHIGTDTYTAGTTATIPGVGTLVINTDGTFTFTPAPNFNGNVPVATYDITDGHGGVASSTLTITVTPVNDAPVANPDVATTPEDTPVSGNVLNNDTDVEHDVLSVTAFHIGTDTYTAGTTATIPGVGTLVINTDGTFTFTPAPNFNGNVPVATYDITDGHGGVASSTLTITVTPVNDAPVANPDVATTPEDTPVSGNVLNNDTDVEHDVLSVTGFHIGGHDYTPGATATIPGVGTLVINTDGTFTFTPAPNYDGAVPVATYDITDGHGGTASSTLTITIIPVNDPPVANPDFATTNEDTPVSGNVLTNDTDIDGGALSVTKFHIGTNTYNAGTTATIPGVGTLVINANGTFTFTPAPNYNGAVPVTTYDITDGNGGNASSTLTINIIPVNDPPVIKTRDITVYVDSTGHVHITPPQIDNGSYDPDGIDSISLDKTNFDCSNLGPNTVTLKVTDVNGDFGTATATVTVLDIIPPTIICPAPVTVQCASDVPAPNTALVTVADNCSAVPSFVSDVISAQTAPHKYIITRTYKATDPSGNSSTCTQIITVNDNTKPVLTFGPLPGGAGGQCLAGVPAAPAAASIAALYTDNCSGAVTAVLTNTTTTGNDSTGWTRKYFYTVSDVSGNTTTACVTYTGKDNTPPNINCPSDMSVIASTTSGAQAGAMVTYNTATATDNCGTPTITYSPASGSFFPVGSTTVTVTANDGNGNTSTCTFKVIVTCVTPTFTYVPANQTHNTAPGRCDTALAYSVTANGTPAANLSYTLTGATTGSGSGTGSGSIFNKGITTVTVTATNLCGSASASFTVTVLDKEKPVITGTPANISVNNDAGKCGAVVTWTKPVSTDNCPGVTQTCSSKTGDFFPVGTTTVTTTATDASGNTTSTTFTVTVTDNEKPTFTCPADINVSANAKDANGVDGYYATYAATTVSDNCGTTTTAYSIAPGSFFAIGNTPVVVTVTDSHGNVQTCTLHVIVNCVPPVITATSANQTHNTASGRCDTTATYAVTASGIPSANLSYTFTGATTGSGSGTGSGSIFNKGITTVTVTATNMCGAVSTTFTITVLDKEKPVITGTPANISVNNDAGKCGAVVTWTKPVSTDNCPGVTQTCSSKSGDFFPVGTTTVTTTATDASGNTTSTTFTVTVTDNEKPTFTCPADINVSANAKDANGVDGYYATYAATTVSDNCGTTTTAYSIAPGSFFAIGNTPVVVTVTDSHGNVQTCTLHVIVNCVPPVITATSANQTHNTASGRCDTTATYAVTASGIPSANLSYTFTGATTGSGSGTGSGSIFNKGITTVTVTATNMCGAVSTTFTITVLDKEKPVITGTPANISVNNDAGKCGAVVTWTKPVSTDNCPGVTQTCSSKSGDFFPVGTTTVTTTATDASGNTTSTTFTVTVTDNEKPTFTCPADINVSANAKDANGVDGYYATYAATTVSDNCGTTTTAYSIAPGSFFAIGNTPVVVTVTDSHGNVQTCTLHVIVNCVPPVITATSANQTHNTASGRCDTTATYAVTASGIPSANLSYTFTGATTGSGSGTGSGSIFNKGITTVTVTATNMCGAVSTTFTITVLDKEKPVITGTPANISVNNDAGKCGAVVTWTKPVSTDNCPGVTQTCSSKSGDFFPVGTTTVTTTATDASGNTTSTTFTVTVTDNEKPTFTCPADINVSANAKDANGVDGYYATYAATTVSDNCGTTTTAYSIAPGSFFAIGNTPVVVTVTDSHGNIQTCTLHVIVNCVPPVITATSANQTHNTASGRCDTTATYAVTASGIPSANLSYTFTGATTGSGSGTGSGSIFNKGITTVTVTATNMCGAVSTTFTITVLDKEKPVITGTPANITKSNDAGKCGAVVTWTKPVSSDNCPGVTQTCSATSGSFFPVGTTTVTTTATDASGNTTSTTFTVTVTDDEYPTITAPADVTVYADRNSCSAAIANVQLGTPATGDNCKVGMIMNDAQDHFNIGTTIVTWSVADYNGHTSYATQKVTVLDNQLPVIVCPAPITVACASNVPAVNIASVAASDNCSVTVSFVGDVISNQTAPNKYTITRTYKAIDPSGNFVTCSQIITVKDTIAPVPTVATLPTIKGQCSAMATAPPTATDNCAGTITATTLNPTSYTTQGTYTITWNYADGNGNSTTQTQTVIVKDVTPPVITCPSDITTVANTTSGAQSGANVSFTATATDNCTTPTITYSPASGSFFPTGTTIVTATANDGNGNTSTCTFKVNITCVAPVFTSCSPNLSVNTDAGKCSAVVTYAAPTTGTPTPSVTYTFTGATTGSGTGCGSGATFNKGVTTVTVTANSICATAVCSFTITVADKENPVIVNTPGNISKTNDAGKCGAVVTWTAPTTTDNCGATLTSDHASGELFPVGVTTVTYTSTDAAGNKATSSFTVTVTDTEKPVINCPSAMTVNATSVVAGKTGAYVTYATTATDNCGTPTITYSPASGSFFPVGINNVTVTAVDAKGNSSSCTFTVTVGCVAPVITVSSTPTNNTFTGGGVNTLFLGYGAQSTTLQVSAPTGSTYVWSGSAANKLSSTTTANPVFTPSTAGSYNFSVLVTNGLGCQSTGTISICVTDIRVIGYTPPTSVDPDDNQGMCDHQAHDSTDCPHEGHNHICDHKAHSKYTCHHKDTNDYDDDDEKDCDHKAHTAARCPHKGHNHKACDHKAHSGYNCEHDRSISYNDVKVCDHKAHSYNDCTHEGHNHKYCNHQAHTAANCPHNGGNGGNCNSDAKVYLCHVPPGNPGQHITLSISVNAVADHLANHPGDRLGTCEQIACTAYTDVTPPVIVCPAAITVNCGTSTAPTVTGSASATDNMGLVTVTYSDVNGSGIITRTWKAADAAGNISTCAQIITIVDNVKPVITDPADISINCGTSTAPTACGSATATDNCSTPVVNYTDAIVGNVITRTWKATDASGNFATSTQIITIVDNVKPVITDPADVSVNCGTSTVPSATIGIATATDNCSTPVVTYGDIVSGNVITRTWTATDASGNVATSTQKITLIDAVKPVITTAANITVNCGSSTLPAATGTPTATDNCSTPVVSYTDATVGSVITRTWKATDASGNYSTSTQVITIMDVTKPVLTVPAAITLNCGSSSVPSACGSTATATDACSTPVVTYTDATSGNVITRTWKATDAAGNFSTGTQTITIVDVTKPVITDPADITISCGTSTAPTACGSATATDACGTPVVSYTDATSGNVITRTWKATDAAGNFSTSTQLITIVDNVKPVITDPADITVNCGASTLPAATGTATATDNCSTPTVNYGDVTVGNVITRTWTATDASGNTATSVQLITIGAAFSPAITSVPTSSTYTGGVCTNLYLGYGAQSTTLQIGTLPTAGAPYTYVWSGTYLNLLNSSTSAAPVFTPTTFGYYTYSVTVTNKYGCKATATISICVTDVRVPGCNGSKVYVCHTPSYWWGKGTPQTIELSLSQVSSHLGSSYCGSAGDDRLGSSSQSPCNTTITTSVTKASTATAKDGEPTAAVATSDEDLKVTAMPNPSTTFFTLKIESRFQTPVELRVMDGRGRVVDAKSKLGANSTIQIGHNYSSGTYYAELIQGTQRKVVQLIKGKG